MPYEKIGNEERCLGHLAPFEIPASWEWCRVGDLFANSSGLAYKKTALSVESSSMIRVLRGGNIGDEEYCFKGDDVFISRKFVKDELLLKKGYMITPAVSSIDHIGKIALIEQDYDDVVVGGFVLMLKPFFADDVISQYLLYAFAAKNHRDNCRNITNKSGQAFYNLSREKLMNLPVPIPPRNEMLRINLRLKELMSLVSHYSVIEQQIDALNAKFPDQLRKSILQLAVQGKLIPQDQNDEPASVLLERIRAEKEQLIKAGKIKRDKHDSVIYRRDNSYYEKLDGIERCIDDEIAFKIPRNWVWVRLFTVASVLGGKRIPAGRKLSQTKTEHFYIRVSDMKNHSIKMDSLLYVPDDIYPLISQYIIRTEDIYITVAGTIGSVGIIPPELDGANLTENADRIVFDTIDQKWLMFYLSSPFVQNQIADATTKVGQPKLAIKRIENFLIALPPLSEQRKIVEKIEELEIICETL